MIDFVADTGDGWQATFAVAFALAQPWLYFDSRGLLQRGEKLIVGGDVVYPYPSEENLLDRFIMPYRVALSPRPVCYTPDKKDPWIKVTGRLAALYIQRSLAALMIRRVRCSVFGHCQRRPHKMLQVEPCPHSQ